MAPLANIEVFDAGNDVLLVRAEGVKQVARAQLEDGLPVFGADGDQVLETVEQPVVLQAFGHVSATTNHYDAEAYAVLVDEDGSERLSRADDAEPRAMTPAEVGQYALGLLEEQNPDYFKAEAEALTPVHFELKETSHG